MPGSTRSWAGVPRPPLWKGSCLTSPSSAPACAPVASTKGAFVLPQLSTSNFGTRTVFLKRMLESTIMLRSTTNIPMRRVVAVGSMRIASITVNMTNMRR